MQATTEAVGPALRRCARVRWLRSLSAHRIARASATQVARVSVEDPDSRGPGRPTVPANEPQTDLQHQTAATEQVDEPGASVQQSGASAPQPVFRLAQFVEDRVRSRPKTGPLYQAAYQPIDWTMHSERMSSERLPQRQQPRQLEQRSDPSKNRRRSDKVSLDRFEALASDAIRSDTVDNMTPDHPLFQLFTDSRRDIRLTFQLIKTVVGRCRPGSVPNMARAELVRRLDGLFAALFDQRPSCIEDANVIAPLIMAAPFVDRFSYAIEWLRRFQQHSDTHHMLPSARRIAAAELGALCHALNQTVDGVHQQRRKHTDMDSSSTAFDRLISSTFSHIDEARRLDVFIHPHVIAALIRSCRCVSSTAIADVLQQCKSLISTTTSLSDTHRRRLACALLDIAAVHPASTALDESLLLIDCTLDILVESISMFPPELITALVNALTASEKLELATNILDTAVDASHIGHSEAAHGYAAIITAMNQQTKAVDYMTRQREFRAIQQLHESFITQYQLANDSPRLNTDNSVAWSGLLESTIRANEFDQVLKLLRVSFDRCYSITPASARQCVDYFIRIGQLDLLCDLVMSFHSVGSAGSLIDTLLVELGQQHQLTVRFDSVYRHVVVTMRHLPVDTHIPPSDDLRPASPRLLFLDAMSGILASKCQYVEAIEMLNTHFTQDAERLYRPLDSTITNVLNAFIQSGNNVSVHALNWLHSTLDQKLALYPDHPVPSIWFEKVTRALLDESTKSPLHVDIKLAQRALDFARQSHKWYNYSFTPTMAGLRIQASLLIHNDDGPHAVIQELGYVVNELADCILVSHNKWLSGLSTQTHPNAENSLRTAATRLAIRRVLASDNGALETLIRLLATNKAVLPRSIHTLLNITQNDIFEC